MKCMYCGKEINEMTERYHVYTLDGDFIHDECAEKQATVDRDCIDDLLTFIEECDIVELTEFLKENGIKFEESDNN